MDDRRKQRTVIDWQLIESPSFLSLRIDIGIGATHEPEHGRNMPLGPERPEIFARRSRPGLPDSLGREMPAKRIGDARGGLRIIQLRGYDPAS